MQTLAGFNAVMEQAFAETAPHKVCAFIYELANAFNSFYHETKILAEEDKKRQAGWIRLITLAKDILNTCMDLLGMDSPEHM